MQTAHRYHSIEADGPWTSEPFLPAERRHIVQGVIGGFIMGRPRWATDLEGNFIYGLDAKGKEMKTAPSHATKRSHATKKKSKTALDREVTEALSKLRSKNFKLGLHAGYGGEWWIWRTSMSGDIVDTIGPFRSRERADEARINLLLADEKNR
jgi:hypothetical protein